MINLRYSLLFYAVIASAMIAPISSHTVIPNMADFINHLAEIIQAKSALVSGQFPLRIATLWNYPVFQFYSPSTYLFAGLIYEWLTPGNALLAYQGITWASLVLGALYMARVCFWFTRVRIAALLGGVVYMAAPYNIITQFRIGDLNEGVALGVLPVVLFYTLKYFNRPENPKTLLKLAVAYYFLITTHLVTSVYFTLFVFLLLGVMSIKNKKNISPIISVAVGYGLGLLLAAWYLGPVIFFQKYLYVSGTYQTTEYLTAFRPFISDLFSMAALITPGHKSAVATLHPALGWPILFGVMVSAYAFLNRFTFFNNRADDWLPAILLVFAIVFIFIWSPINFWRFVPTMFRIAQYSWRLLGQVMWLGAILFSCSLVYLCKNQLDKRHALLGAFLIMLSVNAWFVSEDSFGVALDDFQKKPFLVFNNNAYLINFEKYPNFVSEINNLQLNLANFSNLNAPIQIPCPLLKIATQAEVVLEAHIPKNIAKRHYTWAVFSHQKEISKGRIQEGHVVWRFMLPNLNTLPQNEDVLGLQFALYENGKKISTWFSSPIEKANLIGFTPSDQIIDMKKTQKICVEHGNYSTCHIKVPEGSTLLELPSYYYPGLLKITLNGKEVPYHGVLNGVSLVAGIKPIAGAQNDITVSFRGLHWANQVSVIAWIGLLFYGIWIGVKSYRISREN